MTLPQVEKLIDLLDHDKKTKIKFIKRVKTDLYKTHTSFLSTPLLATLMLLTFEQYADIPDKVHIFYDNAFETLFKKHDALKEQYVRVTRSALTVDVFRKVFSAFCAISYSESRFTFTRDQLLEDITKSISYFQAPCTAEAFLSDLVESVCLLQLEGFDYFFVHRSFQEYFCALFLSNADANTRKKFLDETWSRLRDNVLPMLFDMSQEVIEEEWVKLTLNNLLSVLKQKGNRQFDAYLMETASIGVGFDKIGNINMWYYGPGEYYKEITVLKKLYSAIFLGCGSTNGNTFNEEFVDHFPAIMQHKIQEGDQRFIEAAKNIEDSEKPSLSQNFENPIKLIEADHDWLEKVGSYRKGAGNLKALREIKRNVDSRSVKRMTFLDGLFD